MQTARTTATVLEIPALLGGILRTVTACRIWREMYGKWCSDVYGNIENSRVMRGGSWSSHALDARVSCRGTDIPTATSNDVGFRCVK